MALCVYCNRWLASVLRRSESLEPAEGRRVVEDHIEHDNVTIRTNFVSCWLCFRLRLLFVSLETTDPDPNAALFSVAYRIRRGESSQGRKLSQIHIYLPRDRRKNDVGFQRLVLYTDWHPVYSDQKTEYIYSLQRRGDQDQLLLLSEPDDGQQDEDADLALARSSRCQWMANMLDECIKTHKSCSAIATASSRSERLPRRLVQLGNNHDTSPKLIETAGLAPDEKVIYATLSYCWGEEAPIKLMKSNHGILATSIPVERLSLTIQHAMHLCLALGLRFLWVDSLCIIQDSSKHEDWHAEAANMHNIYGGSLLNIAATSAARASDGFLTPQKASTGQRIVVSAPGIGEIWAPDAQLRSLCHSIYDKSPLLKRGWVLQECLLAPRVLHWTQAQVIWQCNEKVKGELCDPYRLEESPFMYRHPMVGASNIIDLDDLWFRIAHDFSRVNVTMAKDRIFALSGLAAVARERYRHFGLETRYAAGCWEHCLLRCICWRSAHQEELSQFEQRRQSPEEITGISVPSWSWLKVRETKGFFSIPFESRDNALSARANGLLVEYEDPDAEYGALQSAVIRMTAPLFTMSWTTSENSLPNSGRAFTSYSFTTETQKFSISTTGNEFATATVAVGVDQGVDTPAERVMSCALIHSDTFTDPAGGTLGLKVQAMLLSACEQDGEEGFKTYRRAGMLQISITVVNPEFGEACAMFDNKKWPHDEFRLA